jgi:hypothetical protein
MLVATALACGEQAAQAASPVPTPTASAATATPAAVASPTPSPSPSPIVTPRDAPPVRSTTPPIGPTGTQSIPPLPESLWLGSDTSVNVAMATHSQRPFIAVVLNGHPATFVVDTSAAFTYVDAGAATDSASGTIALQIGDLRFPRLQPLRLNVRYFCETYLGAPADGIVGRDLLARYPVLLDFPNHTMTVFRDSHAATAVQPPAAVPLGLRVIDGQPAVQGSIDGQPAVWLALTTGASFQVQAGPSGAAASRYAHAEHALPFQEPTLGGDVNGQLIRAHALTLGPLTFSQPLVALLDMASGHPKSELSGALGASMLTRLSVLIDESAGSAAIFAPPGATSALLYDPSGITLMARHGTILIRSVVPGTPADAAHLRQGDEILSINGLAPTSLDFAQQLLDGSPGTHVVISYRRWHVIRSASITLHVII